MKKKLRKKYEIPHPGLGPENTEKIPKNTKIAPKLPFLYFFGIFFRIFGAQPGVGDSYFFRNFFVFSGFRGFCDLYQARRVANLKVSNSEIILFRFPLISVSMVISLRDDGTRDGIAVSNHS